MKNWHTKFAGGREWRVTPDGIQSRGAHGDLELHRTAGAPRSARLYMALWGDEIAAAASAEGVPVSLLLMVIATENGPARVDESKLQYIQVRREPGYVDDVQTPNRISVGPCHVLISSARTAMGMTSVDRGWLLVPANNIRAAARFIRNQKTATDFDPLLVSAAYNAGGLYEAAPGTKYANRWRLRVYGDHLDRAAAWYGDACRVLLEARNTWALDAGGLGRVVAA